MLARQNQLKRQRPQGPRSGGRFTAIFRARRSKREAECDDHDRNGDAGLFWNDLYLLSFLGSFCTAPFSGVFETPPSDLERLPRLVFCQTRKPPRNALSLSPARLPEGSPFSFFTFPPPRTTSSGSRAATRRFTTSVTKLRHFFLPYFFTPRIPT